MRCTFALLIFAATLSAQIRVTGEVKTPLTIDSLSGFPTTSLAIKEKDATAKYPAALLADLLAGAGATFDEHMGNRDLHAKAMKSFILVTAKDGYQVVFSLAELDPKNSKADVRIAMKPDHSFFLSVPSDLTHARDVRDVKTISIMFASAVVPK